MTWARVFAIVTCGALAGMIMGGLFGFAAGSIAPTFFARLVPWNDVEPRGLATIMGSVCGVLLGGGLATFGLVLQALTRRGRAPIDAEDRRPRP